MKEVIKEACVESIKQAIKVQKLGATRLELVTRWVDGGLTPSEHLIKQVLQNVCIPIRVMIRPRSGDFLYSDSELKCIAAGIESCKKIGVDGVVFGILKADKTLDLEAISKFAKLAFPLKVVIHKAIDETPDILIALKQLLQIPEISTVLTSGGKLNAREGADMLKKMMTLVGDRIEIMAQGDISPANFDHLHKTINASAYHGKYIVGGI
ncbi:copper homeostasis protein CutC [Zunongwangia endophytica]|uniref:Copper homeostasis protein cutC homolog n=1 Tax=Zunongwangia endophytica TaxID=1808945 RepID=A0ABV8HH15_9FLAO|nr:copper homeostasis protein CutC [Zunongwangia endophytica]MDN3593445.1 copper homeostasis protein CutC [Zunongwangia endophytica]